MNSPTLGTMISHYRILRLLGTGGMGEVYLADDTQLDRRVAIKVLPPESTADEQRKRRLVREAKAVAKLDHPNICSIYQVSEEEGRSFIVMPYVDGETLDVKLKRTPLELRESLDIAVQVAGALAEAHSHGIIHRDLKPQNIMVDRRGQVKVMDFGLAKLVHSEQLIDNEAETQSLLTTPGVIVGTVPYMSPEQVRGESLDGRSDLFSAGAVFYELVTGQRAFTAESAAATMSAVLTREPLPLMRFVTSAPEELHRIITKALRKDREERYQTARDLLADLRALKEDIEFQRKLGGSAKPAVPSEAVSVEPTEMLTKAKGLRGESASASVMSTTEMPAAAAKNAASITSSNEVLIAATKRRPRRLLLGLTLLVIAAAAVGYWLWKWSNRTQPDTAPQSMKIERLTSTGKATRAAIAPDGKYVVYAIDDNGQQSLWLSQVTVASQNQIVPPADVTYLGITFSRDGSLIYYVRNEQNNSDVLYQAPSIGGNARKLNVNVNSPITFSPDGKQMAFVRKYPASPGGDALIVANADGGEEKTLFTRKQPNLLGDGGPAWSPDGKMIACINQNWAGIFYSNLFGVRVDDGVESPITSQRWEAFNTGRVAWVADGSGLLVTVPDQSNFYQIWQLSSLNDAARRIVNDLSGYADITLTADSGTLAAVRTDRRYNIWVAPTGDASVAKQITTGGDRSDGVGGIDWTPDSKVVYRSRVGGSPNIWVMAADGTGNKQLSVNARENDSPSVSPDGSHIVWVTERTGVSDMWRMDIDGGNPKQLTNRGGVFYPRISPDGKWVHYGRIGSGINYHSLWKVPIDGGEPVQLTKNPSWAPVVSPNGKLIACNWLDETSRQWKIAILPSEGGLPSKIFDISGGYTRRLRWTPDGRSVVLVRTSRGVSNLWGQPIDGGPARQLTEFKDLRIANFAYSRDGKQLAFSRGTVDSDVVLISGFKNP